MDIKRQTKPSMWQAGAKWVGGFSILIIVFVIWQQPLANNGLTVDKSDVWYGNVETGTLKLTVQGFGKLKSKHQRLITAPTHGIVEEIMLKPGAVVTKDDVILRLLNPDLDQQANTERLMLGSEQATLRQIKLNNQRELLAQQAFITELESNYEVASFNLSATTKLAEQGIVSEVDYKRAQLNASQLKKRLAIENQRLEQLNAVHNESIIIQQEKIVQQQSKLNVIEEKRSSLVVRANIAGVLQKLDIALGQSVTVGETLAYVGGTDSLIAEINIPQNQVDQIQIGQSVAISTRQSASQGKVSRIDPVVSQGTVLIEVDLLGRTLSGARPDLTVDATIEAGELNNINYIERPVNVQPGATLNLFKVSPNQDYAQTVAVTFGAESGKYIQVISGVSEGEQLILSDTSRWQQFEFITLN